LETSSEQPANQREHAHTECDEHEATWRWRFVVRLWWCVECTLSLSERSSDSVGYAALDGRR
jgi:hypothetical protein